MAGKRRTKVGRVVSDKMDKTVVIKIDHAAPHRVYGKIVRHTSKLQVHDEKNEAHVGDTIRVMETRPLSKTKRWRIVDIVTKAE